MAYPYLIQGKNIVVVIGSVSHTISSTHIAYERVKAAIKAGQLPKGLNVQRKAEGLHCLIDGLISNWVMDPAAMVCMKKLSESRARGPGCHSPPSRRWVTCRFRSRRPPTWSVSTPTSKKCCSRSVFAIAPRAANI